MSAIPPPTNPRPLAYLLMLLLVLTYAFAAALGYILGSLP